MNGLSYGHHSICAEKPLSKFPESRLALKNKILDFSRFPRLSFTYMFRNVIIWCALDSPDLGKSFKYLECYHITHRKRFSIEMKWHTYICVVTMVSLRQFLEPANYTIQVVPVIKQTLPLSSRSHWIIL